MRIFITGYKGFIGSSIYRCLSECLDVYPLEYNRGTSELYPQLNQIMGEDVCIVHSGASSQRDAIGRDIYKDNWTAVIRLVNYIRDSPGRRLVFLSANSISGDKGLRVEKNLYSHLKQEAEEMIEKTLMPEQYTIMRLPGVYHKEIAGEGLLDKICCAKTSMNQLTIRVNSFFNSVVDVEDLGLFLRRRLEQKRFDGHIGALGSINPVQLGTIIDLLDRMNKIRMDIVMDESSYESTVIDPSRALALGYIRRDTLSLIKQLFESK